MAFLQMIPIMIVTGGLFRQRGRVLKPVSSQFFIIFTQCLQGKLKGFGNYPCPSPPVTTTGDMQEKSESSILSSVGSSVLIRKFNVGERGRSSVRPFSFPGLEYPATPQPYHCRDGSAFAYTVLRPLVSDFYFLLSVFCFCLRRPLPEVKFALQPVTNWPPICFRRGK
jgi:hypothetical protein